MNAYRHLARKISNLQLNRVQTIVLHAMVVCAPCTALAASEPSSVDEIVGPLIFTATCGAIFGAIRLTPIIVSESTKRVKEYKQRAATAKRERERQAQVAAAAAAERAATGIYLDTLSSEELAILRLAGVPAEVDWLSFEDFEQKSVLAQRIAQVRDGLMQAHVATTQTEAALAIAQQTAALARADLS